VREGPAVRVARSALREARLAPAPFSPYNRRRRTRECPLRAARCDHRRPLRSRVADRGRGAAQGATVGSIPARERALAPEVMEGATMRWSRIALALLALGIPVSLLAAEAPSTASHSTRDRPRRDKVELCHCSRGSSTQCHTLTVGAPAVRAHLAHGDTIGPCAGAGRETACCLPSGCEERVAPALCRRMGGAPFGLCATCGEVICPDSRCIGAVGSCAEAHPTPGCDSLYCCEQICRENPYCCDIAWDDQCADTRCRITLDQSPCCTPDGSCGNTSSSMCIGSGGGRVATCSGDSDGDGVDDACACTWP
jgi:hypothetical protein